MTELQVIVHTKKQTPFSEFIMRLLGKDLNKGFRYTVVKVLNAPKKESED